MDLGVHLKIFVTEHERQDGELLYEWILERAKKLGIPGGSAFRAIAGFGRHGVLHEEGFFELAGNLPVQLEFIVNDAQADQLLAMVKAAGLDLVYARMPVEFGLTRGKG
jgi:PII-like signaling protein